jgi:hypothetical protein
MLKEHGVPGAINVGDDRAHRSGTRFLNLAYPDGRLRTFAGQAVEHMADGLRDRPARRLPGALAALHSDRAAPRLTEHLLLRADDGHDHVEIRIRVTNCGALAHTVAVEARPESAGVALDPDAPLGLWERGTVIASLPSRRRPVSARNGRADLGARRRRSRPALDREGHVARGKLLSRGRRRGLT